MTRYILLVVHEDEGHSDFAPTSLVGVYDTPEEGLRNALFHCVESGGPDELDLGQPDAAGDYLILFPDESMAYQLLRWSQP